MTKVSRGAARGFARVRLGCGEVRTSRCETKRYRRRRRPRTGPLRRPRPQWYVEDDGVVDPRGDWHLVKLQLPGTVNLGNAATALAVAAEFGVRPIEALPRLATVASVAGRYAQVERDGRNVRLLLAKNPASWLEAFDMAEQAPTLLSVNARLALIAALSMPAIAVLTWLFAHRVFPISRRVQQRKGHLTEASDEAVVGMEMVQAVERGISQLPDQDCEIIIMRHFEQLSNQEIAQALELTEPAASMRYLRAIKRLKAMLNEGAGGREAGDEGTK